MKRDTIGKVNINYEYYTGSDLYSEGTIEDDMLEIAKSSEDYEEILKADSRWSVLYHFSPIRENIVSWYPFEIDAKILEIGSGCGAVTGALCKNTKVTCVELSKKRALINANRHKNIDNIEIIVGNFNDIKLDQKYDYITLIGVLEYARAFTEGSDNPYVTFLKKIKEYLKPGGKLLVAIENKYGLKYWAGAKEDHTATMFEGLEGYKNNPEVCTFSKKGLTEILENSGFHKNEFYYPFPDYKFPNTIYSDKFLPNVGDLNGDLLKTDFEENRIVLFNEQNVFDELIKDKMFDLFSNSYLVIAE